MANKKVYIIENTSLMEEWDWDENNKCGLDPEKLTRGSGKEANWICSNGHKWKATIYHRASRGQKCPYCSNRRILSGYNDLQSQRPDLMSEWDFEANTIDPAAVALKSNKVAAWICPKGHKYKKRYPGNAISVDIYGMHKSITGQMEKDALAVQTGSLFLV